MEPLNILVVAGHPADLFDHCGGTLAHHVRRGDHVTCVGLTHGARAHDIVITEELRFQKKAPDPERLEQLLQERARVKHAEVVEACAILGITDVRFLNYDDNVLLVTHELVQAVARVIGEVKPHIVITHHPLENGGVANHHGTTGKIVLHAIGCASTVSPGDPSPGYRVAQVFFMSPVVATFVGSPLAAQASVFCDYYVDITDVIELKVKAWDRLRSQQYGGNYGRKAAEAWNGKEGLHMRVGYAEGFVRCHPEIGDYLTVSRELLDRANEPDAVSHARTDVLIAPFVELPE